VYVSFYGLKNRYLLVRKCKYATFVCNGFMNVNSQSLSVFNSIVANSFRPMYSFPLSILKHRTYSKIWIDSKHEHFQQWKIIALSSTHFCCCKFQQTTIWTRLVTFVERQDDRYRVAPRRTVVRFLNRSSFVCACIKKKKTFTRYHSFS